MIQRLKELMTRPSPRVIQWSEEERQAFLLFSRSTTGRKLLEFLRQHASTITFNAVRHDRAAMNAYARGVQDTVLMVTNLAALTENEVSAPVGELEPLPSQRGRSEYIPRGSFSGI